MKKKLIIPIMLALIVPLIASWFAYPDTHLPPGFGVFPPQFVAEAPGFNLIVFCALALVELVVLALYIYPTWFGFKEVTPAAPNKPLPLPIWFWAGLVSTLFFWWLMWTRVTVFGSLVYYAFTPLWWSFIFTLDGVVYRYNNGQSLLSSKPKTLVISALVSLVGWRMFEYYNYFALGNWYYPQTESIPSLSHEAIVVIFLLAYTTVWPAIFQWYMLLNTCPSLTSRYSQGPKVAINGNVLLYAGYALLFLMVFWPYPLFWVLWIGVLMVFSGLLIKLNIWTPFADMAKGNWTSALLVALATMFNGFVWECWNYGSAHPQMPTTNPNYWVYDIPYVNVIHIFSEMPLLGYMGYMPFGVLALVMWIWAGNVFGFDTKILDTDQH
nr:mechanosensitive ion channel protein MscS [uncultured Methylotenera sp.]